MKMNRFKELRKQHHFTQQNVSNALKGQQGIYISLVDLLFEFHMLTDLDPHLHVQLKALEKEYSIDYGFEKIREDYTKR